MPFVESLRSMVMHHDLLSLKEVGNGNRWVLHCREHECGMTVTRDETLPTEEELTTGLVRLFELGQCNHAMAILAKQAEWI